MAAGWFDWLRRSMGWVSAPPPAPPPAGDAPIHVVEFGQVPTVAQFRNSVPTVAEFGGVSTVAQFPTRRIP